MNKNETPYSSIKIFSHHQKLTDIEQGKHTAPIYIRLKPTNSCNQNCYYCAYADKEYSKPEAGLRDSVSKNDYIPYDKIMEIVSDMQNIGVKSVTLSGGGEPLTYKFIIPTMQKILESNIDLSIITNGELLHGQAAEILSNARWVRISLDSATKATYAKSRGIKEERFERVCENISLFSKKKQDYCELGINFVINHENAYEVYDAVKLVKELGANNVKLAARITKNMEDYHLPFKDDVIKQIYKAKQDFAFDKFTIINNYEDDVNYGIEGKREYKKCYIQRLITIIGADCKVYFCINKAYSRNSIIGDISNISFKELWFSDEVIKRLNTFDPQKECNHSCAYDERNSLLNSFFSLNKNHINFI